MKVVLALLLIIPSITFAMGGGNNSGQWVNDWWKNTYELRIKQQQTVGDCPSRLNRYRQKAQENPNSTYYRSKLKKWEQKCRTH